MSATIGTLAARTISPSAAVEFLVGAGDPDDIGARLLELADLVDGGLGVRGERVGHGLHRDRGIPAHGHRAHVNLARLAAQDVAIGSHATHGAGLTP